MAKGIKTGGRVQGTQNLLTKEMRELLKGIIANELQLIPKILEKLEPIKRIELMVKLIPFVLPRVESVKMNKNEPDEFDWDN